MYNCIICGNAWIFLCYLLYFVTRHISGSARITFLYQRPIRQEIAFLNLCLKWLTFSSAIPNCDSLPLPSQTRLSCRVSVCWYRLNWDFSVDFPSWLSKSHRNYRRIVWLPLKKWSFLWVSLPFMKCCRCFSRRWLLASQWNRSKWFIVIRSFSAMSGLIIWIFWWHFRHSSLLVC